MKEMSEVLPILATRVEVVTPLVFKFSETNFKDFLDIPLSLLKSIALCFKDKVTVCRKCFYGERSMSKKAGQDEELCSSRDHKWFKPIKVIPGCNMCDNEPSFQKGEHIPIPPLPPITVLRTCANRNHHKCFTKSLEQDLWQAHSVEELVVWIVESEKDCPFEEFAKELQLDGEKSNSKEPTSSSLPVSPPLCDVSSKEERPLASLKAKAPISKPLPGPVVTTAGGDTPMLTESRLSTSAVARNMPQVKLRSRHKYHPRDIAFVTIDDIPEDLLSSVTECFMYSQFTCRICFFESNCKLLTTKRGARNIGCEKGHIPWKSIRVIPRSPLCLSPSDYVSVPPLPKHMKPSSSPFIVCNKNNHKSCYSMSKGTNPWFPHTVEELVIWTVERDAAKSFEEVYKKYLPKTIDAENDIYFDSDSDDISTTSSQSSETLNNNNYYGSDVVEDDTTRTSPPFIDANSDFSETGYPSAFDLPDEQRFKRALNFTSITSEETDRSHQVNQQSPLRPQYPGMYSPFAMPQSQPYHSSALLPKDAPVSSSSSSSGDRTSLGLSGIPPPGFPVGGGFSTAHGGVLRGDAYSWNHRNDIYGTNFMQDWSTDNPYNDGDMSWSRAVGNKQTAERTYDKEMDNNPSEISVSATSSRSGYMFNNKDCYSPQVSEELVHQSQVENDSFQPYASILPSAVVGRRNDGVGRDTSSQDKKWWSVGDEGSTAGQRKERMSNSKFRDAKLTHHFEEDDISLVDKNKSSDPTLYNITKVAKDSEMNRNSSSTGIALASTVVASERAGFVDAPSSKSGRFDSPSNGEGTFPTAYPPATNGNSGSSKSKPDAFKINESNGSLYSCLLCYNVFKKESELALHCSSDVGHLEMALLDSGADEIWKYSPPPPKKTCSSEQHLIVCTRSKCRGHPYCTSPHSKEEQQEWLARWLHREHRRINGALRNNKPMPEMGTQKGCLPVSTYKDLETTLSEPYRIANNCYCWDITLHGENWLNLFGVSLHSSSSWIFKIACIEETVVPSVFHPHSSSWSAPPLHGCRVKQCLPLGSIQITVKAIPPSNKMQTTVSGQIRLDIGYKELFSIDLRATAESSNGKSKIPDTDSSMNQQKSFVPQHHWELPNSSSDDDDLGNLNIEGEDMTLQHVPIEDWGYSLTDDR